MKNITSLPVTDLIQKIQAKEITATELTQAFLDNIKKSDLNAFITITEKEALNQAKSIDQKIKSGKKLGALAGIPFAAKDIFATKDIQSTGGSKILKGYKPPVNATAIQKLLDADAILLGKTNCDEFAQGGSGEHSAFGPTKNPHDTTRVTGGSSSGSAAAVAADLCAFSLGTDTGGSIRQPAALCGITGLKVTYGRVSRSGVFSMTSSLDTIGPLTKTVQDAALILKIIAGQDPHDQTTPPEPVPDYLSDLTKKQDLKHLKIAIPSEISSAKLDSEAKSNFQSQITHLKKLGAQISEISLPHTKYSVPVYYIIVPSEVSANMERFDGVRFGPAEKNPASLSDFYIKNRSKGFGDEVKRRIMVGTHTLSSGFYDAFYQKAAQVRTLIKQDFDQAFAKFDLIIMPTTPTPAWKIGAITNPLDEYLQDFFTIPANLTGLPAISIPSGITKNNLPLGLQIIAPQFAESKLLQAAHLIQTSQK